MTDETNQTYQRLKLKMERPHLFLATTLDIRWDANKNYRYNGNSNQAAAVSLYAILSFIPLFILTMLAANYIFGSRPVIQHDLIETIRGFNPYFSESLLEQLGHIEQKNCSWDESVSSV